jgi:hypothetical protein
MAPAQSSLSKPNIDDQMRRYVPRRNTVLNPDLIVPPGCHRVSVVIYQHICRSEKKRKARAERLAQGAAAPPLSPEEEEEKEDNEDLLALFGEDQ